ncbi:MAG: hypothetical protein ACJ8AW_17820 [Rhodopila sp.]
MPVQTRPLVPPPAPPTSEPAILEVTRQPAPVREPTSVAEASNGLLAKRVRLPKDLNGSAFLLPFSPSTGAAAFRSADVTYLVFDERRPVDLAGLKGDPVFAQAFA